MTLGARTGHLRPAAWRWRGIGLPHCVPLCVGPQAASPPHTCISRGAEGPPSRSCSGTGGGEGCCSRRTQCPKIPRLCSPALQPAPRAQAGEPCWACWLRLQLVPCPPVSAGFGYGPPPPPPDQFAPPGVPPPPATPGAAPLAFPPPPSQAAPDLSKPPTAQPDFPYSQYGECWTWVGAAVLWRVFGGMGCALGGTGCTL